MSEKNKKKITISLIVVIAVALIWFLIISPLIEFKKSEKEVLNAGKRYFEVNKTYLPTGNRIKTISLKTLYNKDFIKEDIKVPNSSSMCDENESWVKVQKKNNEYNYNVYLKCGIYSSKVDHKGPTITLKGENEITVNKGDKFKDPGIASVSDNTDGKIDTKQVKVDSNVNINKNGTYEIKYSIKDSFDNKTEVIRTVKVVQILDKIVKKETDKTNYYKGNDNNNYIKLDGILFKIVGLNEDGSVKVTSSEPLAFVDYNSVDTWLNDYFYDKLSDNVKKYIKTDSKWCNEVISNTDNYTKCNKYGKKKAVGLLSVADVNNSKDKDGNSNLGTWQYSWLGNSKKSKLLKSGSNSMKIQEENKNTLTGIRPTINLKTNLEISSGSGEASSPYLLKGRKKSLKAGEKISEAMTGEYILYSGYTWRVIGKESDGTTKIVMNESLEMDYQVITTIFDKKNSYYNPTQKTNIGYKIANDVNSYINVNLFDKKSINVNLYKKYINYSEKTKVKQYKTKIEEVSLFDLYSPSTVSNHWFRESTSNGLAYMNSPLTDVSEEKIINGSTGLIKLTANLNKNVSVKKGNGLITNPYNLVK